MVQPAARSHCDGARAQHVCMCRQLRVASATRKYGPAAAAVPEKKTTVSATFLCSRRMRAHTKKMCAAGRFARHTVARSHK